MPRQVCLECQRPVSACICDLFIQTDNCVHVVVVQHPSESKRHKGSVPLLANSLTNCHVITTDTLADSELFQQLVATFKGHIGLLYPSEVAIPLESKVSEPNGSTLKCLILLDGTWKKAYRLYMENSQLHQLPHYTFSSTFDSKYIARHTGKKGALSTLEACCHALALLEDKQDKYAGLMESFVKFNQRLLSFPKN